MNGVNAVTSSAEFSDTQDTIKGYARNTTGGEGVSLGPILRQLLPRLVAVTLVMVGVALVLQEHEITIDPGQVWTSIRYIPPTSIALAACLCVISFGAVACYDIVSLRLFRHAVPPSHAARTGFTAVAMGQMLGFGIVVATLVRWRHYRAYGIGIGRNAGISFFIAVGFLLSLCLLVALSGLMSPTAVAAASGLQTGTVVAGSLAGLALGASVLALCYLQPRIVFRDRLFTLPRFRAVRNMLILAVVDVIPAAGILWLLLPADSGITFGELLPVFIAALALGLASNAPAGIGILEVACLLAWPHVAQSDLLGSLLLFRLIYYILPFLAAGYLMVEFEWNRTMRGQVFPKSERRSDPFRRRDVIDCIAPGVLPVEVERLLRASSRAEDALARLGDKSFLMSRDRDSLLMFADRGNNLVALSEPAGSRLSWYELLQRFEAEARTRMAAPVFYKAGPAFAAFLARSGYGISLIGHDAIIRPQSFDIDARACRELRRKVRQAQKSGLEITLYRAGTAPLAELRPVSDAWLAAKPGGERGFSMGRFDTDYLSHFDILVARYRGRAVGFISILKSGDAREWSIDLMRSHPDAPQGTMHALIADAIDRAKQAETPRFSLCSVAFALIENPGSLVERLLAYFYRKRGGETGLTGLHRFKRSFDPTWEPVYLCARSKTLPVSALVSIRQLVVDPDPLQR